MTFGEKLKLLRNTYGLNQEEFSETLGITRQHLSLLERDEGKASRTLLLLIACRYKLDVNFLTDDSDQDKSKILGNEPQQLVLSQVINAFIQLPTPYQRAVNAMVRELLEAKDESNETNT